MTNTGGTEVTGYDYYPFGKELRSSISGTDSRFMFQGKEFDTEVDLDLYYFEARFYRPDIGRFAAPDPVKQGWSYYSFTGNNPIRFTDPSGMSYNENGEYEDYQWGSPLYEQGEEIYIEEFDLGTNGVTENNPYLQPGSIFVFADGTSISWGYWYNSYNKRWAFQWTTRWMEKWKGTEQSFWMNPWDWQLFLNPKDTVLWPWATWESTELFEYRKKWMREQDWKTGWFTNWYKKYWQWKP